MRRKTLCDICEGMFSFLAVAWGRELNEEEKRLNQILINEKKAEKCTYFDRYFNQSFQKRVNSCEALSIK